MRIYIATAFKNITRYREVKKALEDEGHEITFDWTEADAENTMEAAMNDLEGVDDADIVVGIFEEEHKYKGAIFEIGYACAKGIPIVILGNWLDSMVFMKHPEIYTAASIEELIVGLH